MQWHRYLTFPDDVHLSREAEDLIRRYLSFQLRGFPLCQFFRLITSEDKRLDVEQIKQHHFFYGVDWDVIRQIDAPFVPHLRSITDTSYFPTDELDQTPESATTDSGAATKDLAFLGLVFIYFNTWMDLTFLLTQIHLQTLFCYITRILNHHFTGGGSTRRT